VRLITLDYVPSEYGDTKRADNVARSYRRRGYATNLNLTVAVGRLGERRRKRKRVIAADGNGRRAPREWPRRNAGQL
jgi:hypothetical protein